MVIAPRSGQPDKKWAHAVEESVGIGSPVFQTGGRGFNSRLRYDNKIPEG